MPENTSVKRVLIDKANRSMYVAITIASVLLMFTLVSMRSLYKVSVHRQNVIKEKKLASDTLAKNDIEVGKLITAFKSFEETPESLMGTAEKNSKIVLDALPPEYDFPALATSLEKILTDGGYNITSINGIDNEVGEADDDTSDPQPIEVPFTIGVSGPYDKIKNLPADLERSIRPIHILSIDLSGSASDAVLTLTAKTYYQPAKNLDSRSKEVK